MAQKYEKVEFLETAPFYAFKQPHLSESIISEILKLWGKCFSIGSKFNLDSKNAIKLRGNFFDFLDNCILIGKL